MRVLITGATGFIGRLLVDSLIAAGDQPIGLALPRDISNHEAWAARRPELELRPIDLRNAAATAEIVAQVCPERIINLAAAGVTDPSIDAHVALNHNVHGAINLIQAAFQNPGLANPPRQLVMIRTPGEKRPSNAYSASKAAAWKFCQMFAARHQWPIVGAMIFQAYGPGQAPHTFVQAALRAALAGEEFAMTSGNQRRDWIFVTDVVEGLVAATRVEMAPGASVDLGTGVGTSLLEVAKLAFQIAARRGSPLPGALPDRAGEEINLVADIDHTSKLLNWAPHVDLVTGLQLVFDSLASK